MNSGKVYGFVGPIGGGKTYQLNKLMSSSIEEERVFISSDFSDGIRDTLLKVFGDIGIIDPASEFYMKWKECKQGIILPTDNRVYFRGRDLLKNIGEELKKLAGEDVWARWTGNDVCKKYFSIADPERQNIANVAFGSIRFPYEAEMVFSVAKIMGKDVKIIFCNHCELEFNPDTHSSEILAHQMILRGCKDGDDITTLVKEYFKIK
jgi:hypothetical protein